MGDLELGIVTIGDYTCHITPKEIIKIRQYLFCFLFVLPIHGFTQFDNSDIHPYISPGISFGHTFGEGFTSGFKLTIGLVEISDSEIFPEISWSSGITFGYRTSDNLEFLYFNLQGAYGGLFGIGAGPAFIKKNDYGSIWERYFHTNLWGGVYGLIQYDSFTSEFHHLNHLGATGVFPLVFDASSSES